MNKVDRIILIFIGFGIWALVILHFIEPNSVVAVGLHSHSGWDIIGFKASVQDIVGDCKIYGEVGSKGELIAHISC